MANPEHLEILKQGVEQWNKWRKEHPEVRPDLSEAELHWAILSEADLSFADLSEAELQGVDLPRAKLSGASLRGANLREADLFGADLQGTNLIDAELKRARLSTANLIRGNLSGADLYAAGLYAANLIGTDLSGTNLRQANLRSANLTEATFRRAGAGSTNFADVDLSSAKGLETIYHVEPSTIGIDTIYKSHGKIPGVFLRGCGVPEEFIEFVRQMGLRPIEFYSCFISYSTKDQEFAERLHADLQAKGVRCWFAPHDVKGGEKLDEQIDKAIRLHDRLLLILSKDSMSSEWVKTEIAKARKREVKEGKRVLFPVRLVSFEVLEDWECFDADAKKDAAREIREYFIPDFSDWKDHDSYQTAFQRLVKDLKNSG